MERESAYFAERLRGLRQEAGLSQPGLYEATGVPVPTIRELEQGRREPKLSTLLKLAAGLGLSLAAFDPPAAEAPPEPPKRGRRKGK
jgi:transcriptional regulator with XRE-family HTH domain